MAEVKPRSIKYLSKFSQRGGCPRGNPGAMLNSLHVLSESSLEAGGLGRVEVAYHHLSIASTAGEMVGPWEEVAVAAISIAG